MRADGRHALRPDLVVRLAGGQYVVVDAKVTLAAYLEAVEADDEATPRERTAARTPGTCASTSTGWPPRRTGRRFAPTPEFVVLFVPGEAFLAPALEHDPALLEHAYARGVGPRDADDAGRAAAHGRLRLAAATPLAENARAVVASARSCTPGWRRSAATSTSSAARSARPSRPTTAPSARWSARCCRPPAGWPTSA